MNWIKASDEDVIFKAKRTDNNEWIVGTFTRMKHGECIVPAIQIEHENDNGDWIENVPIEGETLMKQQS